MTDNRKQKNIYTVKQINSYIKQLFDADFILRSVSVKGEISNCKYHTSGHIYFSLKDESGTISCVMFASSARTLKFKLKDGDKVVVSGSVSIYEASGRYQIYVRSVEEEGKGDLFKKYEELKEKLYEAGYFSEIYKKNIPRFSYRIGVVTSETGAVIRDIFNVSSRRNPFVQIYLYPSLVQGEGAAEEISSGIKTLDKMELDVIIIGRGGGSMEDLWAFNDEGLAKTIFECNTPVISAVGHETDFTISDFVADLRAPTPSAAAELAVFDLAMFEKDLADKKYTLSIELRRHLDKELNRLEKARLKLETLSPENRIMERKQYVSDIRDKMDEIISAKLNEKKELLYDHDNMLKEYMEKNIDKHRDKIISIKDQLNSEMNEKLRIRQERYRLIAERLNGLSPLARISAGYAYASKDGKTVRSIRQLEKGDVLDLRFKDGSAETIIKGLESLYE